MIVMDVLLVRRGGLTWAIKREDVVAITRHGEGVEVVMRAGSLPVEAVLGVHSHLPVRLTGPTLRPLLPPTCRGLAVVAGEPIALLDADSARSAANTAEGGACHGT